MKRRSFLGRVAALLTAPFVEVPRLWKGRPIRDEADRRKMDFPYPPERPCLWGDTITYNGACTECGRSTITTSAGGQQWSFILTKEAPDGDPRWRLTP